MRQGLSPIWTCFAVTAAASWKIFDESSIAVASGIDNSDWHNRFCKQCFVVPFWYNETLLQAMSLYRQRPLALQELVGRSPNPVFCIVPMQASRFCKTLFQHSAGAHSHHGIVMIAGTGSLSQQANEHSRISFYMWIWSLCAQRHCLLLRFQLPFQNSTERVDIAKMWCPARSIILKLPGAWLHPAMINLIGNFCFYWLRWFSWL